MTSKNPSWGDLLFLKHQIRLSHGWNSSVASKMRSIRVSPPRVVDVTVSDQWIHVEW